VGDGNAGNILIDDNKFNTFNKQNNLLSEQTF